MAKTFEQLQNAIIELAAAERITKRVLGELSRDLLAYVLETEDVRPVNNLLGLGEDGKFILTAANWRISCMYFYAFLPFTSNYQEMAKHGVTEGRRGADNLLVFAKKSKKKWTKCVEAINVWLADEANTIWLWQADNVDMKRAKDYAGDIQKAIKKAMEGDDDNDPLSIAQVLDAVIGVEGITAEALFDVLGDAE